MHRVTSLRVEELNPLLTCTLCKGYLIDATSIIECLHAFCRSCLMRHLNTENTCPSCGVLLHKTRPHYAIRSDRALQSIVYKLVPDLFEREMDRRRRFYLSYPTTDDKPLSPEKRGELSLTAYSCQVDEKLSLELEFARHNSSLSSIPSLFLLCPGGLTVASLSKLIRAKLDLTAHYHEVALFCADDCLSADYTLSDVAYIYSWRRIHPLKLYFTILDNRPQNATSSIHSPSSDTLAITAGVAKVLPVPPINGLLANGHS